MEEFPEARGVLKIPMQFIIVNAMEQILSVTVSTWHLYIKISLG